MSRQASKVAEGAKAHLEPGEEIVGALVAAARGYTQTMAGSMHLGASQQGRAGSAAGAAGLVVESPMGVVLTQRRLITFRIGMPVGLGIGGAVKEVLSSVPISTVEGIDVKRLGLGFRVTLRVRGQEIALEANAASGAKGFAAALDTARSAA